MHFIRFFIEIYKEDTSAQSYGDPAITGVKTVDPGNLPDWYPTIRKHAKEVVATSSRATGKKRKTQMTSVGIKRPRTEPVGLEEGDDDIQQEPEELVGDHLGF